MWLIDVNDEKLVGFVYEHRPQYAVVSHRWDGKHPEVSFQDIQDHEKASKMHNFNKIRQACRQASKDGLKYVWLDTCCINKESSAELSEAINSMYRWYKSAKKCYVLLSDVQPSNRAGDFFKQIYNSEWFERGWTLQELIAPDTVVFFNSIWEELGTKLSLRRILASRTGIDSAVLTGWEHPSTRSVAERMSWASRRKTTRVEDEAYCLLGIFGVHMPLLYGEGKAAFWRLQEEIMKVSDDHSIFAWPLVPIEEVEGAFSTDAPSKSDAKAPSSQSRQLHPLLADSPAAFKTCGKVSKKATRKGTSPYSMTNRGLSISLWAGVVEVDTYLVRLNCDDNSMLAEEKDSDDCYLGIFLTCLGGDQQYARVAGKHRHSVKRLPRSLWELHENFSVLHFYVPQHYHYTEMAPSAINERAYYFEFDERKPCIDGLRLKTHNVFDMGSLSSSYTWDSGSKIIWQNLQSSFSRSGLGERGLTLKLKEVIATEIKRVTFGFDQHCNPVCFLATAEGLEAAQTDRPSSRASPRGQPKASSGPFWERRPYDQLEWCQESEDKHGLSAIELETQRGLWAIKGDRIDGLQVDIALASSMQLIGRIIMKRSMMQEEPWRDHIVWEIWLTKLVKKGSTDSHLAPTAGPSDAWLQWDVY